MTHPITEAGIPMARTEGGWYDPQCVRCVAGYVGHGSAVEACECFLDSRDVLSARDFCPPLEEVG